MEPKYDLQVEIIPGLPWVVGYTVEAAEPEPVVGEPERSPSPQPSPAGREGMVEPEAEREGRPWGFLASLGALALWCVVTPVLFLAGALTPIRGNMVFYLVMMAGLFCVAFLLLTCPRTPAQDETGWIFLGGEAAAWGQCTPSRQTLTGRGK